jgi:hypothetical protein
LDDAETDFVLTKIFKVRKSGKGLHRQSRANIRALKINSESGYSDDDDSYSNYQVPPVAFYRPSVIKYVAGCENGISRQKADNGKHIGRGDGYSPLAGKVFEDRQAVPREQLVGIEHNPGPKYHPNPFQASQQASILATAAERAQARFREYDQMEPLLLPLPDNPDASVNQAGITTPVVEQNGAGVLVPPLPPTDGAGEEWFEAETGEEPEVNSSVGTGADPPEPEDSDEDDPDGGPPPIPRMDLSGWAHKKSVKQSNIVMDSLRLLYRQGRKIADSIRPWVTSTPESGVITPMDDVEVLRNTQKFSDALKSASSVAKTWTSRGSTRELLNCVTRLDKVFEDLARFKRAIIIAHSILTILLIYRILVDFDGIYKWWFDRYWIIERLIHIVKPIRPGKLIATLFIDCLALYFWMMLDPRYSHGSRFARFNPFLYAWQAGTKHTLLIVRKDFLRIWAYAPSSFTIAMNRVVPMKYDPSLDVESIRSIVSRCVSELVSADLVDTDQPKLALAHRVLPIVWTMSKDEAYVIDILTWECLNEDRVSTGHHCVLHLLLVYVLALGCAFTSLQTSFYLYACLRLVLAGEHCLPLWRNTLLEWGILPDPMNRGRAPGFAMWITLIYQFFNDLLDRVFTMIPVLRTLLSSSILAYSFLYLSLIYRALLVYQGLEEELGELFSAENWNESVRSSAYWFGKLGTTLLERAAAMPSQLWTAAHSLAERTGTLIQWHN